MICTNYKNKIEALNSLGKRGKLDYAGEFLFELNELINKHKPIIDSRRWLDKENEIENHNHIRPYPLLNDLKTLEEWIKVNFDFYAVVNSFENIPLVLKKVKK